MQTNRRSFLSLLAGIPLIGFFGLPAIATPAKPEYFDHLGNPLDWREYLKRRIERALTENIFELNDAHTRHNVFIDIHSCLMKLHQLRQIYDYRVVCDETNNTPKQIDAGELNVDVYVKPIHSINFIQLTAKAVTTGVEFDELERMI